MLKWESPLSSFISPSFMSTSLSNSERDKRGLYFDIDGKRHYFLAEDERLNRAAKGDFGLGDPNEHKIGFTKIGNDMQVWQVYQDKVGDNNDGKSGELYWGHAFCKCFKGKHNTIEVKWRVFIEKSGGEKGNENTLQLRGLSDSLQNLVKERLDNDYIKFAKKVSSEANLSDPTLYSVYNNTSLLTMRFDVGGSEKELDKLIQMFEGDHQQSWKDNVDWTVLNQHESHDGNCYLLDFKLVYARFL